MREGIELTLKMFQDTLKRYQLGSHRSARRTVQRLSITRLWPCRKAHDLEPNSVLKVFQKGYQLNGRLLRPAMVVVSKAPAPVSAFD